jgi:hypothetical protein
MSQRLAEEQLIRRYFLGDLPNNEREHIQKRLVTDHDPDLFDTFLMIEGELLDDYAFGFISHQDREKLESGLLLSPHEHRKVAFVKALNQHLTKNKTLHSILAEPTVVPLNRSVQSLDQNKGSDADCTDSRVWQRLLSEAHSNRTLIQSLIDGDWIGVEILFELTSVAIATRTELSSLLERDDLAITDALSRLIHNGLVEETVGRYSCSSLGSEILERIQHVIGFKA